ncbi:MAG TPA: hypothetical protein VE029_14645 [Rhizobacter sp.]|nr:hypothetical protein [Rhizobacter sp.]
MGYLLARCSDTLEIPSASEPPRSLQRLGLLLGSSGYHGPHPPVGDPPHHCHIQVLSLDTELDVPPGADRDQGLAA